MTNRPTPPVCDERERPVEEIEAGWKFREGLVLRADAEGFGAPLWHGWAIMAAFFAGIDHAKAAPPSRRR